MCVRLRSEEVAAMSGPDEFSEFYKRLKTVRDFHRRYPNEIEEPMTMEFMKLDQQRNNPPEELQSRLLCVCCCCCCCCCVCVCVVVVVEIRPAEK